MNNNNNNKPLLRRACLQPTQKHATLTAVAPNNFTVSGLIVLLKANINSIGVASVSKGAKKGVSDMGPVGRGAMYCKRLTETMCAPESIQQNPLEESHKKKGPGGDPEKEEGNQSTRTLTGLVCRELSSPNMNDHKIPLAATMPGTIGN